MRLAELARRAARLLRQANQRVVFAESCTGGQISAQLAAVPGISDFLCGSLVTYRNRSKQDWLSVPAGMLRDPGPVSREVAEAMAHGALQRTREADLALAVTGHLGPDAPRALDGLVFIGLARRGAAARSSPRPVTRHRLQSDTRHQRQREAAGLVFARLCGVLEASDPHH